MECMDISAAVSCKGDTLIFYLLFAVSFLVGWLAYTQV